MGIRHLFEAYGACVTLQDEGCRKVEHCRDRTTGTELLPISMREIVGPSVPYLHAMTECSLNSIKKDGPPSQSKLRFCVSGRKEFVTIRGNDKTDHIYHIYNLLNPKLRFLYKRN